VTNAPAYYSKEFVTTTRKFYDTGPCAHKNEKRKNIALHECGAAARTNAIKLLHW
jgi:hypothetical protein